MITVILGGDGCAAYEAAGGDENGLPWKRAVEGRMRGGIGPEQVDLATGCIPRLAVDVARLGLERELAFQSVNAGLGDKILPEFIATMQEVDVPIAEAAQQRDEGRV